MKGHKCGMEGPGKELTSEDSLQETGDICLGRKYFVSLKNLKENTVQ